MPDAAAAFARALDAEHAAAIRADFDALLRIQEEKRALMPEVTASTPPELARALAERARKNLGLLRHLLACVRGQLGIDAEPTYSAKGETLAAPSSALRGRI